MKRPRISTRWLMAAVLMLALALGSGLPAREVYQDSDLHVHEWVDLKDGEPLYFMSGMSSPPFWPRYWRCLLGQPWKRQPICTSGEGRLGEACELNHPEKIGDGLGRGNLITITPEMEAALKHSKGR